MTQQTPKATIARMFSDDDGVSHFEEYAIDMSPKVFAPPAPSAFVSSPLATAQSYFLHFPEGWFGDMHPAPHRQLMTIVHGEIEATVSDGETRIFKAGDTVLAEDVTGPGHASKALGNGTLVFVVQLS
jgi:hypothetical protein